tara:strand:+ start:153 stop:434 length:282 start_codon:yes stop_codon:yes gene_type:complete
MVNVGGYCKASMQKGILEKMKIKSELHIVWITTDGSKFIHKKEAEFWQQHLDRIDTQIIKNYESPEFNNKQEEDVKWRQTKAKQRAIDLKERL